MSSSRQTQIAVTWQSKDITRDLAPHLLSLQCADNLTGAADDLALELEDRDGLWSGDWQPQFGDSVLATVTATPWLTQVSELRLGKFAHDTISIAGNSTGRRVSLKCVSAPMATGLRRRKRTRGWNGVTLQQIASDIADRAGLKLYFDGAPGLAYRHRQQVDKSDLEFLEDLCKDVGRGLKVTEDQIVVFDELARDSSPSVGTLDLRGGFVKSYAFDSDDAGRYGSCTVSFSDPRSGKVLRGQYTDPANPNGQTLELRVSIDTQGEASDRAKAMLRAANRFAARGHIVTVGDPGLIAGVTFDLAGGGGFDGKFIVTKAEHRPTGGYECALTVRRCVEY